MKQGIFPSEVLQTIKGEVPWLGSAERDVDIEAWVEAYAEPEPAGYEPS